MVRLTDHPNTTIDIYRGLRTTTHHQQQSTHICGIHAFDSQQFYELIMSVSSLSSTVVFSEHYGLWYIPRELFNNIFFLSNAVSGTISMGTISQSIFPFVTTIVAIFSPKTFNWYFHLSSWYALVSL